jgi:outer membrane protein OmpA-like peptidoglycan-associated protein/tetratricopeptide (TPR) repeat protein
MKRLILILTIITGSVFSGFCWSQSLHTASNRAGKLYRDGMMAYEYVELNRAAELFEEAIIHDNRFFEAYMMLGDIKSKQKKYSEAVSAYRIAVSIDSLFYRPVFFNLAGAEMMSGEYARALVHFKVYLGQKGMLEKNRSIAEKNIKNCEFAVNAMKHPIPFNPVSIGPSINTTDDEYWPSITADGQTLMFTRQSRHSDRSEGVRYFGNSQEDFYLSFFADTGWQKAVNAGFPLNTPQNEGAQTLSSNGRYMYFTACDRQAGLGSCDLYYSVYNDGKWSEPSNLKWPVNTTSWESQPSVTSDGRVLFFSSSRPGGSGGKDLWYTVLNDKNIWKTPVNMGSVINTPGDEMSPFIHFDGKTLYFASDGRVGMGGFDLYITRMNSDSSWSEPKNLGYPINTYNDEMGLIIESGGQKAYFSSIRDETNGKDIFFFNLYESARPNPVSYLKGKVYDKETGKLLMADYELINLSTGKVTIKNKTDLSGNFLVCLPSGFNYGINVSRQDYLFYSENFMFEGEHPVAEPFVKRINLSPLKIGEKIQLTNVFYEIDSWELKTESRTELDNLVKLLSDNKDLVMEIGGYTDSTGSNEYNLVLSEKRVLSVVKYLVSKGISPDRLKYKGYGNTFPIGDNATAEGRKLNRRTEAKIIARKK